MAYRSYFRSVLNDNFKILTWVLILFIAIMPNFIFMKSANAANAANSSIGRWSVVSNIGQGIGSRLSATKEVVINGSKKVVSSAVNITPSASQVGRFVGKNMGAVAVIGVMDLLLDGVDYALDPANNTLTYNTKGEIAPYDHPSFPLFYTTSSQNDTRSSSASGSCSLYNQRFIDAGSEARFKYVPHDPVQNQVGRCVNTLRETSYVTVQSSANPNYDPQAQAPEGSRPVAVPISTIGQQVIDKAQEEIRLGNPSQATAITQAVAQDIVQEAENDAVKARPIAQALEQAATYPTDESITQPVTDPVTGEVIETPVMDLPKVCEWAPIICEAAQTAINFMTDFEPDAESGEVTIHEDNNIIFDDSQRFSFGRSCPTPEQTTISFFGANQNLEFSYQPLCDFISMIRPFVVAGSYLIGAYIVMGLSRGSAD